MMSPVGAAQVLLCRRLKPAPGSYNRPTSIVILSDEVVPRSGTTEESKDPYIGKNSVSLFRDAGGKSLRV